MALTLTMKAPHSFKVSGAIHSTIQHHIAGDLSLQKHCSEGHTLLHAVALTLVVYSSASPFHHVSSCLLGYITFRIKCLIIVISEINSGVG